MHESIARLVQAALDGDDERAEQWVASLDPNATPQLQSLLTHPSADVRWWAVRSLAALGARPEVIAPLLDDPAGCVRACAALALAQTTCPPQIERIAPALIEHLQDADPQVAWLCALALARMGAAAAPALVRVLEQSPSLSVRILVLRALQSAATAETIPALVRALDDDSAAMQYFAENALERLGVGLVLFEP